MVIHDFRTPANQIDYTMNIAQERINELEEILKDTDGKTKSSLLKLSEFLNDYLQDIMEQGQQLITDANN
jgi:hypothetical protein